MRPPKVAEALLGRFLPLHERDEILGDMAERYARTAAREGRLRARLWYWRQGLAIPLHMLRRRSLPIEFQDLRFALRTLRRSPGFTAVAILTLALGIGANTAIFSIVNGVMLRPLPYPEPERLVRVWEHNDSFGRLQAAWPNFVDWRAQNESFEVITAYSGWTDTVLGGAEPLRAGISPVSAGFFRVLRTEPTVGRSFSDAEHAEGADPVVLVSHSFWQDQLGGTAEIGDAELFVAGFPVTVVGVLPAGFDFPAGTDVWYPAELQKQGDSRTAHNWRIVGRLAEGVLPEQAQEDLSLITARFEADGEAIEYLAQRAQVIPLREAISGPVQGPLMLLLGASFMVILVGCTNLASTLLARGSARSGELAVLRALGAQKSRIVRRLFTESLLLATFGATAGLLLAAALIRALPALLPSDIPRMAEIGLHAPVAIAVVVVSVGAALLFGLLPAWRIASGDLGAPLRDGGRTVSVVGNRGPWRLLVIAEVALALILLTGAGLLMRSLFRAANVDPGFSADGVVAMSVALPAHEYGEVHQRVAYYDELLQNVRRIPGVARAGLTLRPPLRGWPTNGRISIDGGPEPHVSAAYQVADPDYFETLGIPLVRGRFLDSSDTADSAHVVVINEALADLAWPGEDPIGKRLTGGGMDSYWEDPDAWAIVVGVAGDIRQRDLTTETYPAMYFSYRQRADRASSAWVVVRGERIEAVDLIPQMRAAIRDLDSDVPVQFLTMEEAVSSSLGDRRFLAEVLGSFAAMGLLLAALGIYGVVAYTVSLRTREMGIRMALGSAPAHVLRMVLRESMVTVVIGLLLGLAGAAVASRLLSSLLYEISPYDPVALAATALTLLTVAAMASFIPARRAATIDPLITMRAD